MYHNFRVPNYYFLPKNNYSLHKLPKITVKNCYYNIICYYCYYIISYLFKYLITRPKKASFMKG